MPAGGQREKEEMRGKLNGIRHINPSMK